MLAPRHSGRAACFPLIAMLLAASGTCQAQLTNPSFEGGLTGWDLSPNGVASLKTVSYGVAPASGSSHLLLESNNLGDSRPVTSGILESFLGLATGSLTALSNGTVSEGSAVRQTIQVASAGDTLTFSYNFLTDERTTTSTYQSKSRNDFGFFVVEPAAQFGSGANQNNVVTLSTVKTLVSDAMAHQTVNLPFGSSAMTTFGLNLADVPNPWGPNPSTGNRLFQYTFLAPGDYVIAFGVANVAGTGVNTGLFVDNLSLTAVPEPSSWAMIAGIGLCGMAVARRWRSGKQNLHVEG
jgi:hypothetical protein